MEYTFIVNPKSKSGRGGLIWNQVEPELKKRRIQYQVRFTKYEKEATKITSELTKDEKEYTIIVLGGDGTMDEVINGIRDCSKVTLGYIPTGSGNDFTRALKLPTDPKEALNNILNSKKRVLMDVGVMSCKEMTHRFAVSSGIGFDAAVCHQVAVSKLKVMLNKVKLGQLSYLAVALRRLFRDAHTRACVCLDGEETKSFENTYFVAAMNHPYEGGGFFFCPEAKVDDGYLDVIVVSGLGFGVGLGVGFGLLLGLLLGLLFEFGLLCPPLFWFCPLAWLFELSVTSKGESELISALPLVALFCVPSWLSLLF